MPRYNFTLRDGVIVRDAGQEDLPNDDAARAVAQETARAFANNPSAPRFRVVVENNLGEIVCDLPISQY